jgi:predicted phosphoadenosine phosphosulfate sulfurtransferase
MIARVPGAATAGRYCKTELYGYGKDVLPNDVKSWADWTEKLIYLYPNPYRAQIAQSVASIIRMHKNKTARPIPEVDADPLTGLS